MSQMFRSKILQNGLSQNVKAKRMHFRRRMRKWIYDFLNLHVAPLITLFICLTSYSKVQMIPVMYLGFSHWGWGKKWGVPLPMYM